MKPVLPFLFWPLCFTSAHSPASVQLLPNRSQFFEYEQISLSCEHQDSEEWTVRRYTVSSELMSQCGVGWGSQLTSSCYLQTVKLSTTGFYWCESRFGDSSNVINLTITEKPVILHSPAHPVTQGSNVTLLCKIKASSTSRPAAFYKDDVLVRREPTGHMNITNINKSDEGAYKCEVIGMGMSVPSWLTVKDDSLLPASLEATPDSAQLIEYESLSLTCSGADISEVWTVKRFTNSTNNVSICGKRWGKAKASSCVMETVKQADSGTYWCESLRRQRSNSLYINVYVLSDKNVTLRSPLRPVMPGDNVTLRCEAATPNRWAKFYKDGYASRTASTGQMTIYNVSKADEGRYWCQVHEDEKSPSSWLFVRVSPNACSEKRNNFSSKGPRNCWSTASSCDDAVTSGAIQSLLTTLRYVMVCLPYFASTLLMVSRYREMDSGPHPHRRGNQPAEQSVGLSLVQLSDQSRLHPAAAPASVTSPTLTDEDQELDEVYRVDDVTTEYHF